MSNAQNLVDELGRHTICNLFVCMYVCYYRRRYLGLEKQSKGMVAIYIISDPNQDK